MRLLLVSLSCLALLSCAEAELAKDVRQPAVIPLPFHGLWLANADDCASPDWTEGFRITSTSIAMSGEGPPKADFAVTPESYTDLVIATNDPDFGWSGDGKLRLVLDEGGRILNNVYDNRTASFSYAKCRVL